MLRKILISGVGVLCALFVYSGSNGMAADKSEKGPTIREMKQKLALEKASPQVRKAVVKAKKKLEQGNPYQAKVILMQMEKEHELTESDYAAVDPVEKKVDAALGKDLEKVEEDIQKKLQKQEEVSDILSEYRKQKMVEKQLKQKKAKALAEQAKVQLYQEATPEKAAKLAREAIALDPGNKEAQDLLTEARVTMGKKDAQLKKQADVLLQEPQVTLQALKQKYKGVKSEARELFSEGKYQKAAAKWRRALEYVNVLSVYMDMQAEKKTVKKQLSATEKRAEQTAEKLQKERRAESEKRMEEAVRKIAEEKAEQEAAALDRAWKLIREQKYQKAEKIVRELKYRDPSSRGAQILDEVLTRREHEEKMDDILWRSKKEKMATVRNSYKQAIPYAEAVTFPEKKIWQDVIKKRDPVEYPSTEREYTEAEKKVLKSLERQVTLDHDDTPLKEVVAFLRQVTEVNYTLFNQDLPPDGAPITVHIETKLRDALDEITALSGMDWKVEGNGVKIGSPGRLKEYEMRVYDIRDLLLNTEDKEARQTGSLAGIGVGDDDDDDGGGGEFEGFGGGGGDDDGGGRTASESLMERSEALMKVIIRTVAPDSWAKSGMVGGVSPGDGGGGGGDDLFGGGGSGGGGGGFGGGGSGGGGGMAATGGGSSQPQGRAFIRGGSPGDIIIIQTPQVHSEIEGLLKKLREAMHIQVNVQARFVTVRSDFVQEVGFNNWTSDDGNTEIQTNMPLFDTAQDLGLQWGMDVSVLDGTTLNATFRAIQSRSDARVLSSPNITLMNGQRGYMLVETTQNYVSGWDTSGDTDQPDIDSIAKSISLDVRPIVSHDRRYVYMELAPLLTGAPTFQTFEWTVEETTDDDAGDDDDDDDIATSKRTIQLPEQLAETVEATVCVPDRGVLLLGGLTSNTVKEEERGVPVLSKIPLLKRAFSAEGQTTERDTLLILVRPRIIMMGEERDRSF